MNSNQRQYKAMVQFDSRIKFLENKIQQQDKLNKTSAKNNADFKELISIQHEQYRQLALLKNQNKKQIETFQDLQEYENDQIYARHRELLNKNKTLKLLTCVSLAISVCCIIVQLLLL